MISSSSSIPFLSGSYSRNHSARYDFKATLAMEYTRTYAYGHGHWTMIHHHRIQFYGCIFCRYRISVFTAYGLGFGSRRLCLASVFFSSFLFLFDSRTCAKKNRRSAIVLRWMRTVHLGYKNRAHHFMENLIFRLSNIICVYFRYRINHKGWIDRLSQCDMIFGQFDHLLAGIRPWSHR